MKNKVLPSTTMVYFLLLVFGCTSMSVPPGQTQYNLPENELLAREMPELSIVTADRLLERVKVASLLGNELSILPFPYWNVETIKINIEEITTIWLLNVKMRSGTNALATLNITFGIMGTIFAINAEYDRDYKNGLATTAILALVGGVVVGLGSGIVDASKRKKWDFTKLTQPQRLGVLLQIMGVQS